MNIKKVLCVCMGNTCRSPVIEALLRSEVKKHSSHIKIESAGTAERCKGQPANDFSIACMEKRGINLTRHRARFIGDLDLGNFDLIVVAEPEMKETVLTLCSDAKVIVANESEGGISNPFQKGAAAYDEMVSSVERAIPAILAQI